MESPDNSTPGWNLALRFLLELAALACLGWAGWHWAGGGWTGWLLALALPTVAATLWGVFAVPDDPGRSGRAPVPTPGVVRFGIELLVLGGGCVALAVTGQPVLAAILGALNVLHIAFALKRLRWLVKQ